jgi:hypothetical protein
MHRGYDKGVDNMTDTVRSILTRILNQECDNQRRWEQEDIQLGIDFGERQEYIDELHKYMEENGIPIQPLVYS